MNNKKHNIIDQVEKTLNYSFFNKALIEEALTHPSCNSDKIKKNNERLEFLGDAVLNLVIAEELYINYRKVFEDKLSSMRAKLVSSDAICIIADRIALRDKIILSKGEEKNGGRDNPRNIENAMEAIIGAIYLDGGIVASKRIIESLWKDLIANQDALGVDAKTYIQEWAQKNKFQIPEYRLISKVGPSHSPVFEINVSIPGVGEEIGIGANKKEAEKLAALKFLKKYISLAI